MTEIISESNSLFTDNDIDGKNVIFVSGVNNESESEFCPIDDNFLTREHLNYTDDIDSEPRKRYTSSSNSLSSDLALSLPKSTEYQQDQCENFPWELQDFQTLCSREQLPKYDNIPYLNRSSKSQRSFNTFDDHINNNYVENSCFHSNQSPQFNLNPFSYKSSNIDINCYNPNQNSNSSIIREDSTNYDTNRKSLKYDEYQTMPNQSSEEISNAKIDRLNSQNFPGLNTNENYDFLKLMAPDITYKQNIGIRYLQPSQSIEHPPIIIREIRDPTPPPPPPLIIRQRIQSPKTPSPIILREKPPTPILSDKPRILIKRLPPPSPPPRQIILLRYPEPHPKPRDIIIERWLPSASRLPKTRKVIYERIQKNGRKRSPVKNFIVNYYPRPVKVDKVPVQLPTQIVDPNHYTKTFHSTLVHPGKFEQIMKSNNDEYIPTSYEEMNKSRQNIANFDYPDDCENILLSKDMEKMPDYTSLKSKQFLSYHDINDSPAYPNQLQYDEYFSESKQFKNGYNQIQNNNDRHYNSWINEAYK
ncbi:hypothetical protein GJ496_001303 [Pomphorhynchus laevis]|nr:hypothetical protein GJ496_001303 [Pomphorhynchus laevis]